MTTRRHFLTQAIAGTATASVCRFAIPDESQLPNARHRSKAMIPMPSVAWREATPIWVAHRELTRTEIAPFPPDPSGFATMHGSLKQYPAFDSLLRSIAVPLYADFCSVQDKGGRWHMMGIEIKEEVPGHPTLHHFVGEPLRGPYSRLPPIESSFPLPKRPDQFLKMCAPCVVWKDNETALMFYAHVVAGVENGVEKIYDASMRVLQSKDPRLEAWTPRLDPAFAEKNIIFRENFCKDPEIIWEEERKLYLMHYGTGEGWSDPEDQCVLRGRTSPDLSVWSEPRTLMVAFGASRGRVDFRAEKRRSLLSLGLWFRLGTNVAVHFGGSIQLWRSRPESHHGTARSHARNRVCRRSVLDPLRRNSFRVRPRLGVARSLGHLHSAAQVGGSRLGRAGQDHPSMSDLSGVWHT
jgi:hypothetical protein